MTNNNYTFQIQTEVIEALDHVFNSWMQDSLVSREEILSVIQTASNDYIIQEIQ